MSRIGILPIKIPAGVTVTIDGSTVTATGPKGTITEKLPDTCAIAQEGNELRVARSSDSKLQKSMHGLTRTLLANIVIGVTDGFSKQLDIVGVGYKAEAKEKELVLALGYSHPVKFKIPEGITIETPAPTQIKVSGIVKQQVGQIAAEIRRLRPPEPYKGKGILYTGEKIKRKAGKSAVGS
ncbi:MAG: 50S ribosomal protein L6 [Candidatus Latescibacterota bacterium]